MSRLLGETAALTGTIQAEVDVALSSRIGGRLVERLVNVGDKVTTGQLVARLDKPIWLRAAVGTGESGRGDGTIGRHPVEPAASARQGLRILPG